MASGRIVTILSDKGYGFITDAPGTNVAGEIFFHRSAVTGATFEALAAGQEVTFDAGSDPRDPSRFRAQNVRPLVEPLREAAATHPEATDD